MVLAIALIMPNDVPSRLSGLATKNRNDSRKVCGSTLKGENGSGQFCLFVKRLPVTFGL